MTLTFVTDRQDQG